MGNDRKQRQLDPVDIPLIFPRIEGDVERADGGIGRLHATRDLVVHVNYPFAVPIGTTFQLMWNGPAPVAFHLVRPNDPPRTRFPITLPSSFIREHWADQVYCRIIPSNEPPQQTPPLRLRVNLQRPGGKAPEPTEDGHRGLVFELEPEVALEGVSEQKASVGVVVTCRKWENMRIYDLLTLAWGSEKVEHLVQPNEVDEDIILTVTPAKISAAGDSEMLPVAMTVVGNTGNLPDEDARWSVTTLVAVHANTQRMEPPWIKFPPTESRIDLADIGNGAVEVGCYVTGTDVLHYTHVHFFWVGTTEDGFSVNHSETRELTGAKPYYFEVPNGLVSAIAKSSALAYYVLEGPHGMSTRSNYRHVRVEGEIVQWLAPTIEGESDGQIDPDLSEVNIYIPVQAGWGSFDELEVKLLSSDAGGTLEQSIPIVLGDLPPGQTHLTVVLEGEDLRRFKGRVAELFYLATKLGERPRESLRRVVQVGKLVADMRAPIPREAVDGVLDLSKVSEFGTPVDVPFSDVAFGDWVTLCIRGVHSVDLPKAIAADGAAVSFDVFIHDLAPNVDEDISLYYTLKRGNLPERFSLTTPLHIVSSSRLRSSSAPHS